MRIADAIETAVIACKLSGAQTDAVALRVAVTEIVRKIRVGRVVWEDCPEWDQERVDEQIAKTVKYRIVNVSEAHRTYKRLDARHDNAPFNDPIHADYTHALLALKEVDKNGRADLLDAVQRVLDMLGYDLTDPSLAEYCSVRPKGKEWDNPKLAALLKAKGLT